MCMIVYVCSLYDHVPLIEFSYNNSYHSTIGITPFEALYGRKCRSLIRWYEVCEKVKVIHDRFKVAQRHQKSYTDVRSRDFDFNVRDWVSSKVSLIIGSDAIW